MSDSFDELLFPHGENAPLIPYAPEVSADDEHSQPYTATDFPVTRTYTSPNIGNIYAVMEDERNYRAKHAATGALDLWVAAPAAMASTVILETMQTEAQDNAITRQMAAESNDWMINLATTSYVDWKAFGVGVAAWALVSAAGRMRAHHRYPIERDRTIEAIAQSDGFTPKSVPERRKERLGQRVLRAAGALVTGAAAYKFGEHQSNITDIYLAFGLVATAATAVTVSEVRGNRHTRRMRQTVSESRLRQIER